MMHPAHVLAPDKVTVGAGFSGRVAVEPSSFEDQTERIAEQSAVAPGLAPWIAGRMGISGGYEAGLTYSGRSIRVDGRKAFELGVPTLSLGIGASGLLPKREEDLDIRVGGFGADIPILLGIRSDSDIYSAWIGGRGGFEILKGEHSLPVEMLPEGAAENESIDGLHVFGAGLVGFRVGFRYVYAVMELEAAYHYGDVSVGDTDLSQTQLTLSPSGALVVAF